MKNQIQNLDHSLNFLCTYRFIFFLAFAFLFALWLKESNHNISHPVTQSHNILGGFGFTQLISDKAHRKQSRLFEFQIHCKSTSQFHSYSQQWYKLFRNNNGWYFKTGNNNWSSNLVFAPNPRFHNH